MQQYLDLMQKIRDEGEDRGDRTGVGTRSLFGERLEFDLRDGFPLLTTKRVAFKSVVTELLWFLSGRTDNQWLNERGCTIWDEWATAEQCGRFGREAGDLGPVYGHQWRQFGETQSVRPSNGQVVGDGNGVDQIRQVVRSVIDNPESRRHIVSAWNPAEADLVALPPCHTMFQLYVHTSGRLDCHMYQRSADLFLGVPFNIASYALLTHLIAREGRRAGKRMRAGRLIISFGDVHLYSNHTDQVEEQLSREPGYYLPILVVDSDAGGIFDLRPGDIQIEGYDPQPAIPAPVAV